MAVNGASLGVTAAGVVFVYAGFKGVSVLQTIQLLVQGKSPTGQAQVNAITGSGTNGNGNGLPASGPAVTGSGNAGQYQAYAFSLFPQYSWGTDQQSPLISLWNGESGWDPTAYNPGTHTTNPDNSHAFGIPQALPGSKMASAGSDWRTNGYTQIRWGLGYIRSVYGSPKHAYDTWLSRNPHWY